jgi:hypothetical protein
MSLEEKNSIDNPEMDPKTNLSKINLTMSQSNKSTTHLIPPFGIARQTSGLMTRTTLTAINKVHHKIKS